MKRAYLKVRNMYTKIIIQTCKITALYLCGCKMALEGLEKEERRILRETLVPIQNKEINEELYD